MPWCAGRTHFGSDGAAVAMVGEAPNRNRELPLTTYQEGVFIGYCGYQKCGLAPS